MYMQALFLFLGTFVVVAFVFKYVWRPAKIEQQSKLLLWLCFLTAGPGLYLSWRDSGDAGMLLLSVAAALGLIEQFTRDRHKQVALAKHKTETIDK
jgi:hypothetical protein